MGEDEQMCVPVCHGVPGPRPGPVATIHTTPNGLNHSLPGLALSPFLNLDLPGQVG